MVCQKKRLDNRVQICNNSSCEVEREKIFDGAPPSVGGGGVARPPSERNFYLLKVFNIDDRKLKTVFLNLIERNDMQVFSDYYKSLSVAELREELEFMAYEIEYALSPEHEKSFSRQYDEILELIELKEGRDYAYRWPECYSMRESEIERLGLWEQSLL